MDTQKMATDFAAAGRKNYDALEARTQVIKIRNLEEVSQAEIINLPKLSVAPADKYKFIRSIGFGGMKSVLLVRDKDSARNVAMATIPDFKERTQAELDRFIREARITARLEHPNIVPIHDIGVDSAGAPYFTMKFLRGTSLATVIRKLRDGDKNIIEKYNIDQLMLVFRRICNAIAFAHSQNIIHLDLKPDNIHIGEFGEVLVLDWGLAKFMDDHDREEDEEEENLTAEAESRAKSDTGKQNIFATLDGVAKGTPGYMAPEQAAGKNNEKDARTDIYALGAILYSMLTFKSPFAGNELNEVLKNTILGKLEHEEFVNPDRPIPEALAAICRKALARNPGNRYNSVDELRQEIKAYMGGYAPEAEQASPLKKSILWINRHIVAILISIVVAWALLLGAILVLFVVGKISI
ncbi:MAG: serine/threonine protein kinase [Lentisphaeria bacterium]|nr:serine/threonine protein kinase [Lentisphaeria bacterium]